VWDSNRRPVADLYVELMNSMEGDLARARTTGSGRFTFQGLTTGRFRVKIITAGTNFLEQVQDVEILGTGSPNSNDTVYIDFYLKYDPKTIAVGSPGPAEAIFAQDVPDNARSLYKKALPDIKTDKGLQLMDDAIAAYPEYFDALSAAGKEYVERGNYAKGASYLVRAVKVNSRSFTTLNSLAYAAYKLSKYPEAAEAARLALTLDAKVVPTRMLYARALRLKGALKDAETILVETKKIAPNEANAYYELALVYNRQSRNAEAAEELTMYLKLSPDAADRQEVQDLITKLRSTGQP